MIAFCYHSIFSAAPPKKDFVNPKILRNFALTYLPRFPSEQRAQGKFLYFMATLPLYNQPQISVEEQIRLLKSDGLVMRDENKAKHILENISLYRLKSYMQPFRKYGSKEFKSGVTFEDAYDLYKFDTELRKVICSELEKIEVSIRTQMSLIMSEETGAFWFENTDNFKNSDKHRNLLSSLDIELTRSDEETIVNFRNSYSNRFPPSWMTFEISSFGTLSMMYRLLKPGIAKRKVARFYGLSDTVMESWLHSIVYVRNICAHHSRLWNRRLSINALVPRRTRLPFVSDLGNTNRVYYVLSIILYFLQTVNPQNSFSRRLKELLTKHGNIDTRAMGFPNDWQTQTLWQ